MEWVEIVVIAVMSVLGGGAGSLLLDRFRPAPALPEPSMGSQWAVTTTENLDSVILRTNNLRVAKALRKRLRDNNQPAFLWKDGVFRD